MLRDISIIQKKQEKHWNVRYNYRLSVWNGWNIETTIIQEKHGLTSIAAPSELVHPGYDNFFSRTIIHDVTKVMYDGGASKVQYFNTGQELFVDFCFQHVVLLRAALFWTDWWFLSGILNACIANCCFSHVWEILLCFLFFNIGTWPSRIRFLS